MSTEQSLDPQLIEQTKQQIRALVAEISQLTKGELAPQEFYGEFLTRVVSALAAIGGAVWTTNEEGRLALQYQINLEETKLRQKEEDQLRHGRLLYKVLGSGEGSLVPPHSGPADDQQAANPTEFLLVLGPLKTGLEIVGVVEIFQRSEAGLSTQKGYLRFLLQMCDLAADFLKSHQLRHFSDRQVLWTQLEEFTRMVHVSLEPRRTAYTIANEGRRLIDCDRLSVAIRKGNKCFIEAISGQDLFDKRSNVVRLLGRLATEVVAAGDPVWYTGDTRDLAPQIEDAVQEYVDEAHSKTVAVLPLKRPEPDAEEEADQPRESEPPIGALIVEQIEDSRVPQTMVQRVDVVCRHSTTALANALDHQNLFLMPLWRALGKTRLVLKARTLPKVLTGAGAALVALLALILVPADFELQAKGTLEPELRRDVYAGIDGEVIELAVKHGSVVQPGQPLARLRNIELEVAMTEVAGQRAATLEEIRSLERQLSGKSSSLSEEEKTRISGKLQEARQKLESLKDQWTLYLKKQEELNVTSPIRGIVVTWDLYNRLIQRPVRRGEMLMRVADPDGPWQLELRMPEDRMGHITKAQNRLGKDLKVTYILATEPGTRRQGTVKEVDQSAEVRSEEGSTVRIKVAIDKSELPLLRPGTTVTGKVCCGRRSIGYVWFHDLLAFIQSRILFRWF